MKATFLAAFAAFMMAAFCAFSPGPASAQAAGRADIFAVSGIQVDETAANGSAAQTQGFASAARLGFERLARRLTTAQDQARLGIPTPDATALERLARSVDVESERRSGTHYTARLTVRFDPDGVRTLLRGVGFTLIETRSSPVLIVPVGDPASLQSWQAAWTESGFAQELVPLAIATSAPSGAPSWGAVEANARSEAAASAIYAILNVQGSTASVRLSEVAANGAPRDRGTFSAAISGTDSAALHNALLSLAQQANAAIQNDWKARNGGALVQTRARVSATAMYSSQAQWERVKAALEGAASSVISGIRIEAVAREGALVSFNYAGTPEQLGAELNRRGVSLENGPQGPVLRVAGR